VTTPPTPKDELWPPELELQAAAGGNFQRVKYIRADLVQSENRAIAKAEGQSGNEAAAEATRRDGSFGDVDEACDRRLAKLERDTSPRLLVNVLKGELLVAWRDLALARSSTGLIEEATQLAVKASMVAQWALQGYHCGNSVFTQYCKDTRFAANHCRSGE